VPFDLVLEEASNRTAALLLTSFEQSTEFDDFPPVSGQDKVVSEAK
jgi:hypothetical protein